MSTSVSGVGGSTTSTGQSKNIGDMTSADFLKLLISQLSNQDPFEPMKNQELLQQLSAIRSLEANTTLSDNIQELVGQQQLVSATQLIGRTITGVDTAGQRIEGKVEGVVVDSGGVRLRIGAHEVKLANVTLVGAQGATNAA